MMLSLNKKLDITRFLLFNFVIISYITVLSICYITKFNIFYKDIFYFAGILFGILVSSNFICSFFKFFILRSVIEVVLFGLFLTPVIVISTYLAMHISLPFVDDQLSAIDTALGLRWEPFIRFIDSCPWLAYFLSYAYSSFSYQLLSWPVILVVFGNSGRAYIMIISYGVLCFVSSIVSIWFPVLGTYIFYHMDAATLKNINSFFSYDYLRQLEAVRNQPDFELFFSKASGILTFPSVHAAVATLCIWAAWDIKILRWFALLGNILMIVSAISNAGHYLIDIIAGIGNAILSIAVTLVLIDYMAKKFQLV